MLKEQYKCPHFRILVIGRANAGKTTILEKVCGVAQGTKPIILEHNGMKLSQSMCTVYIQGISGEQLQASLTPSIEVSQVIG